MHLLSTWRLALILSPALVVACATEKPSTAAWDCHAIDVPLGHTVECTTSAQSALTEDGPVVDGPAYVCPAGVTDSDCPPPSAAEPAAAALDGASKDFFCTKEDGTRTCKRAPSCEAGSHRDQMDCEPDQSSGLGAGAGAPGAGYAGAGAQDGAMSGAQVQCFYPIGAPPKTTMPAATFEYVLETSSGPSQLHMRLTFSPHFVDNTFGAGSVGWAKQHKFSDLVGSDHAELAFFDTTGTEKLHFKMDYISKSASAPSGYACLGVTGGEGRMLLGDASSITKAMSSLDRNLNERGYGKYVVDSPATTDNYTQPSATPNWDYRVVYEAWIKNDAFGANGFGNVKLAFVHASPSKASSNTLPVEPGPCPPGWGSSASSQGGDGEGCSGSSDNPGTCPPAGSSAPVIK